MCDSGRRAHNTHTNNSAGSVFLTTIQLPLFIKIFNKDFIFISVFHKRQAMPMISKIKIIGLPNQEIM